MVDTSRVEPPEPGPVGPAATWVMVVGAIFGAITLAGLFAMAFLAGARPTFICNSFALLAAVFALGAALSAAFIGGAAGARGQLGAAAQQNSLAFSVGGGIAVLIIAFYVFQSFKPDCNVAASFVRGTLTYNVPEPISAGDLIFQFAGRNSRTAQETQPIYAYDSGESEKYLLYLTGSEFIRIIIKNRPFYRRCVEDVQVEPLTRARANTTSYKILSGGCGRQRPGPVDPVSN